MTNKGVIIERLLQQNQQQAEQIQLLTQENQTLRERITRLEKNSSNSSKPPSSDIVNPKPPTQKGCKRKRGGQLGHKKYSRQPFTPEQIDETINDLILASHRAGMAEVATDVLHNVGNVLNSVNVSVSLIRDKVSKSETENLEKVADMITGHADDLGAFLTEDQRGRHIPVYLEKVAKLLVDEREGVSEQLQSLTKHVEHIKEIVRTQQTYAKTGGVQMSTNLNDVIKDAIEINRESLERYGIQFKFELTELPTVRADKQRILQILVNLINNAKYAISKSENSEKMLTIRCYKHGEDRFRIEVADTQTIHGKTSSKSWGKLKSCSS